MHPVAWLAVSFLVYVALGQALKLAAQIKNALDRK